MAKKLTPQHLTKQIETVRQQAVERALRETYPERLTIRLTTGQRKLLNKLARDEGLSVTVYTRCLVETALVALLGAEEYEKATRARKP